MRSQQGVSRPTHNDARAPQLASLVTVAVHLGRASRAPQNMHGTDWVQGGACKPVRAHSAGNARFTRHLVLLWGKRETCGGSAVRARCKLGACKPRLLGEPRAVGDGPPPRTQAVQGAQA